MPEFFHVKKHSSLLPEVFIIRIEQAVMIILQLVFLQCSTARKLADKRRILQKAAADHHRICARNFRKDFIHIFLFFDVSVISERMVYHLSCSSVQFTVRLSLVTLVRRARMNDHLRERIPIQNLGQTRKFV